VRWERRISTDLIDPLQIGKPGEYFAEFLVDALLRGDQAARCAYYSSGLMNGWLCPNEVRDKENLNPIEGGEIYLRQLNMTPLDTAPTSQPTNSDEPSQEDDTAINVKHLKDLIQANAERVVRKEVTALKKFLGRTNGQATMGFAAECAEFYATHAAFVAATMLLGTETADKYVASNQQLFEDHPPAEAIRLIGENASERLAASTSCLAIRKTK
jgi:hypothetical protein